jgi:xylulokinase
MVEQYLIGVDLGTNGLKVALVDIKGNVISHNYQEMTIRSLGPGMMEQDADEFYLGTLRNIKIGLESTKINPSDVLAIGFDGQMGGLVGIDKEYNPVTHYDIVLDTRSQKFNTFLKENYGSTIFEHTSGVWNHAAKILWWKNKNYEMYEKIYKFITLAPYVAGKMAGLNGHKAYIDYTSLFCSGLSEIKTMAWSDEICHLLGVEQAKLPEIVRPWKIIGRLSPGSAKLCGLQAGTPIVAGCGDQPAGFLAAGMVKHGMTIDVAGSTSVFSLCTDEFTPDLKYNRVVYMNSVLPNLYYALTYVSGGGIALRWFRDQFAHIEKQESERKRVSAFRLLDEKIRSIEPGSGALLFIPHLGGRACPNEPEIRGAWIGLNWGHTYAHLYRAILESIAYDHLVTLKVFRKLFPELTIDAVRVTGGGAISDIWNQIKSDVLNLPYVRLDKSVLAVIGSSMIAGYAVGVYKDLKKTAKQLVSEVSRIYPNRDNHERYKSYMHDYERIFDCIKPIWNSLTEGITQS